MADYQEYTRLRAYFRWRDRGCPSHDDLRDWHDAEQPLKEQIRENAYYRWLYRSRPDRDDWADWFPAEKMFRRETGGPGSR